MTSLLSSRLDIGGARFQFVRLLLMFLLMTAVAAAESNSRKVLFFDLWKLDYWDNVELRQGKPEWVRECEYVDPSASRP